MTIDMTKQYTTRDGRPVRVLCVDKPGEYPVVATIGATVFTYDTMGHAVGSDGNSCWDLIEVKAKRTLEFWCNRYENGVVHGMYWSREAANALADPMVARTECIHIVREYEEGEGL